MRTFLLLSILLISVPLAHAQGSQNPAPAPDCGQNASSSAACPSDQASPVTLSTQGIVVNSPKQYDDHYLQSLLAGLQNRLAALNALDQGTLVSHVGNVQGADLRQSSFAIQGSGPSTPSASTFTLAPGVTPFSSTSGSPTTTTPGTTTTTASTTPTAPAPTAPALTMPSNLAMGSLDTLNEEMQLASEITNLQLLLGGALSDQSLQTFTLGFPITIQPASFEDKDHKNRVAEVEVSVCAPASGGAYTPSIVTLLPRERTYDVAGLVDKSFLGSLSGVLGGVFSVGGSWFWSHQTFYLVQQQQTVAVQRASRPASDFIGRCQPASSTTTFAWQFRPVLGQPYVRPGTTQTFVQVGIPRTITAPNVVACLRIGWRETRDKLNRISNSIDQENSSCFNIRLISTAPTVGDVAITDIGGGLVYVNVPGFYFRGGAVRVGRTILSPSFGSDQSSISFTVPAQDLLNGGAFAVGPAGDEYRILSSMIPDRSLAITSPLEITPFSESQALVKITFRRPSSDFPPGVQITPDVQGQDPYIVTIGDKIFGLRNAPFLSQTQPPVPPPGTNEILLLVPTDVVRSASRIGIQRLLGNPFYFSDSREIPPGTFGKPDFAVSKAGLLSSGDALTLSLVGDGLDRAILVYPAKCSACTLTAYGPTLATLVIQKDPVKPTEPDPTKGLKQVIVCKKALVGSACDDQIPPVVFDVPKQEAPKPSLDKHDPITPHTKIVSVTGQLLDQVASLQHGKIPLSFRLSLDKKPALIIDLPESISGAEGIYSIDVTFSDKSTATYSLTIQAKKSGT